MFKRLIPAVIACSSLLFISTASVADPAQLASIGKNLLPDSAFKQSIEYTLKNLDGRLDDYPKDYEASLLKSLVHFKAGKFEQALREIEKLTRTEPKFRLAHLIRGDMLLARVDAVNHIGATSLAKSLNQQQRDQLEQLRYEARVRLQAHLEKMSGKKLPRQILLMGKTVDKALVVDKKHHRLYVYQRTGDNTPPKLVRDFYVSTGKLEGDKAAKGDLKTPEGVYFVTTFIPKEKLPDKYGVGAFPVNYPNELDRKLGKTGYGIWLHGTQSDSYSRPPRDSEGCVVLTNLDLDVLKKEIRPGITPVVITHEIDWLDEQQWYQEQKSVLRAVESWRQDWESMNVERYLSHYSDKFWSKSHNLQSWQARKRYLARTKTFQKVGLSELSLFAYPSSDKLPRNIVVARFKQDYRSDNFRSEMNKRLYWRNDNHRWQIVYEGR